MSDSEVESDVETESELESDIVPELKTGRRYDVFTTEDLVHLKKRFPSYWKVKTRSHSTVMVPPPAQVLQMMNEDQQKTEMLKKTFNMFDTSKCGFIDTHSISTIFNTMGQMLDDEELGKIISRVDYEGSGRVNFDGFCEIASHFLDDDDAEAMQEELKEAFRLYDKEGNGYITTATLKEILAALDDKLTPDDLDGIISEIDTDGSGTVDFDEFMEMMTGE